MKKLLILLILMMPVKLWADLTGTEGLAIDLSSAGAGTDFTIAFDPTELLGSRTWGDASTDTIVWTWDRATGTDLTMTFGNDLFTFGNSLTLVTGKSFILGTTQWNSADEIDGTKIKDADYGDISVSAGGVWTLDTDVVDVGALDQTISPTLTGRWTFAGEDTGTDVIGLNVNWAGTDPTNGQSEGDFWYDSTLNVYKGYTTHEIILGSAEEPGIIQAKKGSGGTISAGDAVYISGFDGTDLLIEFADADDSSKMPAIGIASATINSGTAGSVTTFGLLEDIINTGGMSVGDGIWITVTGTTGNTLTNTKPTGATTAIQRIATVASSAASGELFVAGALRTNDESNLTEAYIFVGNSSQNSTAVAMSGDVAIIANGTTAIQTNAVALTTDTTGNYSNGNAEAGDALVSIAVEITDNESTAENNPVVFVAGAAQTGGDLGLESDGTFFYTPSTGTVTATEFVGGGSGVTGLSVTYENIGDPGASGSISFDDGETATYTGANDGAISFFTIQNSDADHTGGNMYLLDLDYSADDGDVDADFIKFQDSGSVVMTIQQNGDITTDGGLIAGGAITEGGNAVPNATDNLGFFGGTSSAELYGELSDETGSAAGTPLAVFNVAPVFTTSIQLTGADANPAAAAGTIVYDNTISGIMSGGGLRWYDDNSVRLIVDLETDPSTNDYVVAYNSTADGFYMKADADSGGATAYDDIGDPDASGSISFDAAEGATYTSADDQWVGVTISNTQADNAGDTELLTLAFTDDGDTNSHYLIMSDAAGTQQLEFIQNVADIQITTAGDLKFIAGGGDFTFADDNITTTGTIEGATLTEGGNAVYNSSETPGGSLGGSWAAPTIDDLFIKLGGDVATSGNYDFGGADLEIPQASPAVPDADGEIEFDFTDGSLVIQHSSTHAELGASTDVVVGKLIRCWAATIFEPDNINDVMTVKAINSIEFPHGVVITAIYLGVSENTSYTLTVQNFDDFDTINGGNPTIDAVAYTADTTGEVIDTSPTYDTIAAGQLIMISIPATDVAWIHFEIYYYEPAA